MGRPADGVHDFGLIGFHPGALTGGQDDTLDL